MNIIKFALPVFLVGLSYLDLAEAKQAETVVKPQRLDQLTSNSISASPVTPKRLSSIQNNLFKNSALVDQSKKIIFDSYFDSNLNKPSFIWLNPQSFDEVTNDKQLIEIEKEQAALKVLSQIASLYKMSDAAVDSIYVSQIHDLGTGAIIIQLKQQFEGIPVAGKRMSIIFNRQLQPVAVSGLLASSAPSSVLSSALSSIISSSGQQTINQKQALSIAIKESSGIDIEPSLWRTSASTVSTSEGSSNKETKNISNSKNFNRFQKLELSGSSLSSQSTIRLTDMARSKQVWYLSASNELIPAWEMEISLGKQNSTQSLLENFQISALTGKILSRQNLTKDASFNYRVWTDPAKRPLVGPQGNDFFPHPSGTPDDTVINTQFSSLTNIESATFSRNDPWLEANASSTSGNNIRAYTDIDAPDGLTPGSNDRLASTTSSSTFDYPYDFAIAPDNNSQLQNAAIVQAFYVTNFLHDWLYDSGFNEAAGNGQLNNFGRGGQENDPVLIELQDFDDRNNANMTVPADGTSAKMQVFLWDGPSRNHVEIFSPSTLTGIFETGFATFGPKDFNIATDLVLVNDGIVNAELVDPTINDACEVPFVNQADINGKIAVIDRGACKFVEKISHAESAGAVGVIIINQKLDGVVNMFFDGEPPIINTPSLMISNADGLPIKQALNDQIAINANLFRETDIDHDGALDNSLLIHEWGHFINNRLLSVGEGSQAKGLDEGWSDFLSLLFLVEEVDLPQIDGTFALSGYANSNKNSAYYGIRRMPYSTDMSKNNLSFKHIANAEAIEGEIDLAFGQDGADNAEVHATGEVWASMLWEGYTGLIQDPRHSFTQAQTRMKNYLVASLKASPSNPDFVEARDALLAVIQASDNQDQQIFLDSFAKRGLGLGAIAPNKNTKTNKGVIESFNNGHNALIANAGPDLTVTEGDVVQLDGSASLDQDGTIESFLWSRVSGIELPLINADTMTASFTAPEVSGVTIVVLRLTITDNEGNSASDEMLVSINDTAAPPPPTPPPSSGGGGGSIYLMLILLPMYWWVRRRKHSSSN